MSNLRVTWAFGKGYKKGYSHLLEGDYFPSSTPLDSNLQILTTLHMPLASAFRTPLMSILTARRSLANGSSKSREAQGDLPGNKIRTAVH